MTNQTNATGHTGEPWIRKPVLSLNGRTIELDDIDYARAELCVNALAGIPDPAAFVARARGQEAAIAELQEMVNVCEMDRNRALADANFQRQRYNAQEALWLETRDANQRISAELARLRPLAELYPLAWEECKKHRWAEMADTEQAAHDKARAERGVE